MKTAFSSLILMAIGCLYVTAQTIHLSDNSDGKRFEGIGAVNGGGATSVLLKDYPEPQRSQIMDMVFRPMFGASVSTMLVEVPGDGNSTQGSMPSHSHYRGDSNFLRGYTWWVMQEAKRRNPALSLDATSWSAPAWVGNIWSDDMVDFYVSWLQGLREVHGLELDALGCHNEKGWNGDFAKHLRKAMNERGFSEVKLHGFGNWGNSKMDFLKRMQEDPELADALDAVCAHTFSEIQLTPEQRKMIEDMGKPIWNSEEHVYRPGFDCLISIVQCFNNNYIGSGATKIVNWYDIGATYPLEPYSKEPPMLLAQEPWSGHYTVREALWGYAHYGQFTNIGWYYIDNGCIRLPEGGSMVAMRNPRTGDYSIIAETKGAKKVQKITIAIGGKLSKSDLCVWYSDEHQQFVRLDDIKPRGGNMTITLKPNAVYSLSTTAGHQKGSFADIPEPQPFPIPYNEDFEQYTNPSQWGYLPHYTADLIGCFELVDMPRGGLSTHKGGKASSLCIRQTVGSHTISWAPEWHHYTILGDAEWTDYEVSADVYLNPGDEAGVMGRLCDVGTGYGIWAKGYYLKLDDQGKATLILTRGKRDPKEPIGDKEQQALILARKDVEIGGEYTLAETHVEGVAACEWHRLCLRFDGDTITGYVDGIEAVRATSGHYRKGMAGLIAPLHKQSVSTPYFDNLSIKPLGRTAPNATAIPVMKPLYPLSASVDGRKALIERLVMLREGGIMFGHQDDPFYGLGWQWEHGRSDVRMVCGDYPAVMGFELGGIELADKANLDGVPFQRIREELRAHVRRGGIATISWHPRNPLTGGSAWDNKNKTVVRSILPGGSQHEKFITWMHRLSAFLRSLTDEQGQLLPFIFRPWHENSGSWFWWGKGLCSADEYRSLWNMTQDHLISDGLTNIVWSWSPNYGYQDDVFDTYPGDDRVDIIGLDAYQQRGNGGEKAFISTLNKDLTQLCNFANSHNRLVALTECGYQNLPDPTWWTHVLKPQIEKYTLCYFLVWRNADPGQYFAPAPHTKDAPDFCRMVRDERILLLKDIETLNTNK